MKNPLKMKKKKLRYSTLAYYYGTSHCLMWQINNHDISCYFVHNLSKYLKKMWNFKTVKIKWTYILNGSKCEHFDL